MLRWRRLTGYSTRKITIYSYVVFKFSERGSTLKGCLEVEDFLMVERKAEKKIPEVGFISCKKAKTDGWEEGSQER